MKLFGPDILATVTLAILAGLSLGICLARSTPIGFFWQALSGGTQILLFAAYALVDGVFVTATAGRMARHLALLTRLSRLVTEFAGSACSKARKSPIDCAEEGLAPRREIATATNSRIAGPGASGTAPGKTQAISEFIHRVERIRYEKNRRRRLQAFAEGKEYAPRSLRETSATSGDIRGKTELYGFLGREACARGLDLCYWRDRDAFPRLVGFDLDAVLPRRSWQDMLFILRTSLPTLGWGVLMSVYRGSAWTCLVARHDARIGEDDDFLQIDLHAEFTVSGLPFADTVALIGRSRAHDGVRWLDEIDAAVCAYLQPAIADGKVKARYDVALERALAAAPVQVDALCRAAISIASATMLRRLRTQGERSSLRRGLLRAALTRRPFRTAEVMLHKLVDGVAMYWRPPGRLWTFSGPDGAGKTTVLDLLQSLAQRRLVVAVDRLHTRPYIIPRLAGLLPPSRRIEVLTVRQYEKRLGLLKSIVRLTILIIDLQLGYWLKVRPMLARGHLVAFDRYYQDYFVDSRLRGISLPSAVFGVCARFVPQGHRHVYLMASAEVLETRKRELSSEDATRQIEHYRHLAAKDPRAVVIDTERRPTADIAREVAVHLLDDVRALASSSYGNHG
jgi:thymidylate kinase